MGWPADDNPDWSSEEQRSSEPDCPDDNPDWSEDPDAEFIEAFLEAAPVATREAHDRALRSELTLVGVFDGWLCRYRGFVRPDGSVCTIYWPIRKVADRTQVQPGTKFRLC